MELYCLRHGLAVERGTPGFPDDAARPLTPEGTRKLRSIALGLKHLGVECDLILSSPLVRAVQTAEVIAQGLGLPDRVRLMAGLASGGNPQRTAKALAQLRPAPPSLLLVGHEPDLSELVSWLVTGTRELSLELKKGGLCKLSVDRMDAGHNATLQWLLTPKQLIALG